MFGISDVNSYDNKNPAVPSIYPIYAPGDAPYEHNEDQLRSAIHIPKEFKYGADGKTPVILVPGTGMRGGEAFQHNFAKLLKSSSFGDPVWLNIKGRMNDASHKNAEHVAYAINYLYSVCKKPLAIVAWSQGNLATQWSLKYWPSTRKVVNNFICLSADFNGTWFVQREKPFIEIHADHCAYGNLRQASTVMPFKLGIGNPSMWSQKRGSQFIQALRDDDGDSAYVPTTSIYSRTDEIVQPQWGEHASARLNDARGVGVYNCELQKCAPGTPAGSLFTHETVLSNPIAWALAEDAIRNGGPGRVERIDIKSLSSRWVTVGLSTVDALATEALMAMAGTSIGTYLWKVAKEPELPAYVLSQMKVALQKIDVSTTDKPPLEQIPASETPPPVAEAAGA